MSTRVAFYEQWRDLMRSWGYTVLEADGWRSRDAEPGTNYDPSQLYVEHHDASTKLSGNWGALAYILANRLANIVTARDGQIMLCAAGVEWHAGVGAYPGIPTNGANPRSMGNEVCNSGSEAYDPRCTAAIVAGEAAWTIVAGRGPDRVVGHKEWAKPTGRKTDPSVDMNARRAQVAAMRANPEGDDMPFSEADLRRFIREEVLHSSVGNAVKDLTGSPQALGPVIAEIFANCRTSAAGVADAKEARRMLGVLLGWNAPAAANEAAAVAALRGGDAPDVDEAALAAELAPLLMEQARTFSDEDLTRVATAVADEQARRQES